MKNILKDTPRTALNARLLESTVLVSSKDIKGKRILDIGCGYGWFEKHALDNQVKKIVGIEISKQDLATVKKYIKDRRASFDIAGATDLPFPNNSFDTVVCWEVIEHIPKNTEKQMYKEIYRVMSPGGSFYLSTPYNSFLSKVFDPAWWLIGHRHYSKKQLRDYGMKNGFSIEAILLKGRYFSIASTLNMYIAKWIFRRKPFLLDFFVAKELGEYKRRDGFHEIFVKYRKKK